MKNRSLSNYSKNNKLNDLILFETLSEMLNRGTKVNSYHTCKQSFIGQFANPSICLNKIGFYQLTNTSLFDSI